MEISQLQIHRTASFSMYGRSLGYYLRGMYSIVFSLLASYLILSSQSFSSLLFGLKDAEQIFVQVSTGSSNDTSDNEVLSTTP